MRFEWDEQKAKSNKAKHGVDFSIVDRFDFRDALIEADVDLNYGEHRWRAVGTIGLAMYSLVFTEPEPDLIRVISMRRSTPHERRRYEQVHRPKTSR